MWGFSANYGNCWSTSYCMHQTLSKRSTQARFHPSHWNMDIDVRRWIELVRYRYAVSVRVGPRLDILINSSFQGRRKDAEDAMKHLVRSNDDKISKEQFADIAKTVVNQATLYQIRPTFAFLITPKKYNSMMDEEFDMFKGKMTQTLLTWFNSLNWPYDVSLTSSHRNTSQITYRTSRSPDAAIDANNISIKELFCKNRIRQRCIWQVQRDVEQRRPAWNTTQRVQNRARIIDGWGETRVGLRFDGETRWNTDYGNVQGWWIVYPRFRRIATHELALKFGEEISQDQAIVLLKAISDKEAVNFVEFLAAFTDSIPKDVYWNTNDETIHVKVTNSFSVGSISFQQLRHFVSSLVMCCTTLYILPWFFRFGFNLLLNLLTVFVGISGTFLLLILTLKFVYAWSEPKNWPTKYNAWRLLIHSSIWCPTCLIFFNELS